MEPNFSPNALAALRRLNDAGYEAYLVGGCVRDAILGRDPGDCDITTSALPDRVQAVFAGERVVATGLKHGTVTVLTDGEPLEITTYRRETGYSDHRHPDAVRFTGSLREDLARRDFTVNAMAWHPEKGLVDLFGGEEDLRRGLIRCVGRAEDRFAEDALRILRALRFSSVLGFPLEEATARAAEAQKDLLAFVSAERIAAELTKLLCGGDVLRVVTSYWPILAVPLPELAAMAGFDQCSRYHCYDVLTHCAVAAAAVPPERIVRWAALLHDAGKPACFTRDAEGNGHFYGHAKKSAAIAERVLTRLRFDRDAVRRIVTLVELHDIPIDPPEGDPSRAVKRLLRRLGEEDFFRLLAVKRGDALAHAPRYRGRTHACDRIEALAREILAREQCFSLRDLAVKGDDLLALGIPRGPVLGRTLEQLLEAVISGTVPNEREALLALAREKGQSGAAGHDEGMN